MGKQYKTSHKIYSAWNYEREIEELNKASEQGWQLVYVGIFSSKFKRNPDVRYRYQLDYQPQVEDRGRYIETFREQGWEYINTTFNGWSYFRKLYDPSLPGEQYEIFTDWSSLREMNNRWARVATGLSVIAAVFAASWLVYYLLMPKLPVLIQLITMIVVLVVLIRGIVIMKNTKKRKNVRWDSMMVTVFFLVLIVGCGSAVYLQLNRLNVQSVFAGDEIAAIPEDMGNALEWKSIDIPYSDYYFINLGITADSPICFTILDESGQTVYTLTESSADKSDMKLYLRKGTYRVCFSDYPGGSLNIDLWIR